VDLKIGTDSGSKGVKPGRSFFQELKLFKKAGLSLSRIGAFACLADDEMERGNYLLVEKDFIEKERIGAAFIEGRKAGNFSLAPPNP
jgi:hypothetical protein